MDPETLARALNDLIPAKGHIERTALRLGLEARGIYIRQRGRHSITAVAHEHGYQSLKVDSSDGTEQLIYRPQPAARGT